MKNKKRRTESPVSVSAAAAGGGATTEEGESSSNSSSGNNSPSNRHDATSAIDACNDSLLAAELAEGGDTVALTTPLSMQPRMMMRDETSGMQIEFAPFTPDTHSRSSSVGMAMVDDVDGDDDGESATSTFRRLNFTTKECATPGRYEPRQRVGQPLAVYCRVKPILNGWIDGETNGPSPLSVESSTSLCCVAPKESASYRHGEASSRFTFTQVFGPDASQEEVYTATTKPIVEQFYHKGENGLIFAYGITASGKSFTVQGTKEKPGLIPRIVADLFKMILTQEEEREGEEGSMTGSSKPRFTVRASYLEIYNETINDLLVEPRSKGQTGNGGVPSSCRLVSGKGGDDVSVVNLREVTIATHREAFALLQQGQSNRSIHETSLNSDSSRSHSVFTLKLIMPNGQVWSRLSVVDLAGSERTSRVAASAVTGHESRHRETVNINQSLLVLGRCLEALRYNQQQSARGGRARPKVVPFRESLITRLFKDALSGWGRTVMIAAASQNTADYDETLHALKYAAIAKEIRVAHKVDTKRSRMAARSSNSSMGGVHSSGVKRAAPQPLLELDELEHLPSSSPSASARRGRTSSWDDESNPSYTALLDECFNLRQRNVELELAAAQAEMSVREELTQQQEEQLQEMEMMYFEKIEKEQRKAEEKAQKLLEIWKMEYQQAEAESRQDDGLSHGLHSPSRSSLPSSITSPSSSSTLTALRRENASLHSTNSDLSCRIRELESALSLSRDETRQAEGEAANITKRIKAMEREMEKKEEELERNRLMVQELKNDRERMSGEYESSMSELRAEISALQSSASSATAAAAEAASNHAAQLAERDATIQQLRESMKAMKKEKDAEMKEMKKAHDAELKALKKNVKEGSKEKESAIQAELNDVRSQLEATLSSLAASESRTQELEQSLSIAQSEVAVLRSQSTATLKDARKERDAELKEMRKAHDAGIKALKKAMKEESKEKDATHTKEMQQLRAECQAQLSAAQSSSTEKQQELGAQVVALQSQLANVQAELLQCQLKLMQANTDLAQWRTKLSETESALEQQSLSMKETRKEKETEMKTAIKQKEAELKEMKKEKESELKELKKVHDAEIKALKKSAKQDDMQRESALQAEIGDLRAQLDSALVSLQAAQSESQTLRAELEAAAAAQKLNEAKKARLSEVATKGKSKAKRSFAMTTSKPAPSTSHHPVGDDFIDPFAFDASIISAANEDDDDGNIVDEDDRDMLTCLNINTNANANANNSKSERNEKAASAGGKRKTAGTNRASKAKAAAAITAMVEDKENDDAPTTSRGRSTRSRRTTVK